MEMVVASTRAMTPTWGPCVDVIRNMPCIRTARPALVSHFLSYTHCLVIYIQLAFLAKFFMETSALSCLHNGREGESEVSELYQGYKCRAVSDRLDRVFVEEVFVGRSRGPYHGFRTESLGTLRAAVRECIGFWHDEPQRLASRLRDEHPTHQPMWHPGTNCFLVVRGYINIRMSIVACSTHKAKTLKG